MDLELYSICLVAILQVNQLFVRTRLEKNQKYLKQAAIGNIY